MDSELRKKALEINPHPCTRCGKYIQFRKPVSWCNKCLNEEFGHILDKEGLERYSEIDMELTHNY